MSVFSLDGKVALVTGGGKGIGKGISRAFGAAGAAVAVASRTEADVESVAKEINDSGGRAISCPVDVTDFSQLPGLVDRTVSELGGLDILVNCAGGGYHWYAFTDTTVEMVEQAFHFTTAAVFELTRLAVPHLVQRPGASIINIGSVTVGTASRGHLTYEVAKAGLTQMTKSLAADLGPKIRVNIIHPSAIETEGLQQVLEANPEMRASLADRYRMRRIGTPTDIAGAAIYLASEAASWVTGISLDVNGGAVDESRNQFPDL